MTIPRFATRLSIVLSSAGYKVICFADGAALLSVARSRTPACILLDVHIPGKSGLDILKELHGEDCTCADLHDLRPRRYFHGGQRHQEWRAGLHQPFAAARSWRGSMEAIGAYVRRQAGSSAARMAALHFPGREPLTRRERGVLEQFTSGASTKPDAISASAFRVRSRTTITS